MFLASNLKLLRKQKGVSQEEVSTELGLTRSTYSGYENNIAEPGLQNLIAISNYYGVNIDSLIKKDFMLFQESDWEAIKNGLLADVQGRNLRVLSTVVSEENEEIIEMIPEKARAGYVSGYSDPEYIKVLPTFQLPFLKKDRKYRSFPISGDSMPPVCHGSYVVAEYLQNWEFIQDGKPYIVITKDDGIVFKIVYNQIKNNQSLQLCSTNPFYQPYSVSVNEVIEVWKFVNYISPELPEVEIAQNDLLKSVKELQKEVYSISEIVKRKN